MAMNGDQLAALVAIVDHGTFEAAARDLSITPSAVSQRVRALESQIGRVVVQRTAPCRPTEAGEVLLRMARQLQVLESEARAELAPTDAGMTDLPVAVNADSLATWFPAVLDVCAGWGDVALRLHVEDQDHSSALLRSGEVVGAVTSDFVAVQGCSVEPLGMIRYLPVATPTFAERWAKGRGYDWAAMPVVQFNAKDELQQRVLRAHHVSERPPTHVIPSSQGFLAAVHAGLGWGTLPEDQLGDDLRTGRLVRLSPRQRVDIPLYWQCWRLRSPGIDRLTDAVRDAASASLR